MKKVLVLGWYWNVWGVASKDLAKSWFDVVIGWRNEQKMKNFVEKNKDQKFDTLVIDFDKTLESLKNFDIVVNCLDFSLNQKILQACLENKVNYIDLGDSYEWIQKSLKLKKSFEQQKVLAVLGWWSSPGIINIMLKYLTKDKKQITDVKMSFADINHKPSKNLVLPFNFRTVIDEVLSDALIFQGWKYDFVPWASEEFEIDFWRYWKQTLFSTAHDENYSIPHFLKSKWLKSFRYVMAHEPRLMRFVKDLKDFGFLNTEKTKVETYEISPFDFTNSLMQKFMPQETQIDDQEILWLQVDWEIFSIENFSQDGIAAWVMNTGIWISIIAQYMLNFCQNEVWMKHPEDVVENIDWFFEQLKSRWFLINPKL